MIVCCLLQIFFVEKHNKHADTDESRADDTEQFRATFERQELLAEPVTDRIRVQGKEHDNNHSCQCKEVLRNFLVVYEFQHVSRTFLFLASSITLWIRCDSRFTMTGGG